MLGNNQAKINKYEADSVMLSMPKDADAYFTEVYNENYKNRVIKNEKIRESLKSFKNVEHRLEKVPFLVKGVEFVNDSKATNVNSVWYALDSMTKKVIWIAGGTDKGNDYSELYKLAEEKVKALVCLGIDNEKLKKSFGDKIDVIVETRSMKEAVETSFKLASPGDVVLLSPACASFDLFKSYVDRGLQFKQEVRNL